VTDPANDLADLFERWTMRNATPFSTRVAAHEEDEFEGPLESVWVAHERAFYLFLEVRRAIKSLRESGKPVGAYDWAQAEWIRCILSVDYNWSGQAYESAAIRPEAVALLRSLSLVLSFANPRGLEPAAMERLTDALRTARDLLTTVKADLEDDEVYYVFTLLGAAESFIGEHEVLDAVDLKQHLDRLKGALFDVAIRLEGNGKTDAGKAVMAVMFKIASVTANVVNFTAAAVTIYGGDATITKVLGG
jgi:hypothetical protein